MTFLEHMRLRLSGKNPPPSWAKDKLLGYEHARKLGIGVAHVFQIADSPEEIEWGNLPNQFVAQTTRGCCCKGTMPLRRHGDGYINLFDEMECSLGDVHAILASHKHQFPFRIMVKEFIIDESFSLGVPLDYKFFCFGGETIGMIIQILRSKEHPKGMICCDREWGIIDKNCDIGLRVPKCADQLASQALVLAKSINTPFVRVDMFASSRGPIRNIYEKHNIEWGELWGEL